MALSFSYKGDRYVGENYEKIAKRICRDYPNLKYDEILQLVRSNSRDNKITPSVYSAPPSRKKKSLKDYLTGASALISVSFGGNVEQEEINRRAIQCSNCPKREEIPGCMSCGFAGVLSNSLNKIKKAFGCGFVIPNGLDKNGCGVCDCALSVMLPAKMSSFKKDDSNERPIKCWANRNSDNFIDS